MPQAIERENRTNLAIRTSHRYVSNPACSCGGFPVAVTYIESLPGGIVLGTGVDEICPRCEGKTYPLREDATGRHCGWCGSIEPFHGPADWDEHQARIALAVRA